MYHGTLVNDSGLIVLCAQPWNRLRNCVAWLGKWGFLAAIHSVGGGLLTEALAGIHRGE